MFSGFKISTKSLIKILYLAFDFQIHMKSEHAKVTIGRRETVDFPELNVYGIVAKVDTGAYTTELQFDHYFRKEIKNSFGETENRYIIKTIVKIGRKRIKSVISLTDRGTMRYPVLIGRKLLKNRFIVDVSLLNNVLPAKKINR